MAAPHPDDLPWLMVSADMNLSFLDLMSSNAVRAAKAGYEPHIGFVGGKLALVPRSRDEMRMLSVAMEKEGMLQGISLRGWGHGPCSSSETSMMMASYAQRQAQNATFMREGVLAIPVFVIWAEMMRRFRWFYPLVCGIHLIRGQRLFAVAEVPEGEGDTEAEAARRIPVAGRPSPVPCYRLEAWRIWEIRYPRDLLRCWQEDGDAFRGADFHYSLRGAMPLPQRTPGMRFAVELFYLVFAIEFFLNLFTLIEILYQWPFSMTKLLGLGFYAMSLCSVMSYTR